MSTSDTISCHRRNVLSLGEKVQIIAELDKGKRAVDVCRQFSLVSSTVCSIRKNRDKILSNYQKSGKDTKRIRAPTKKDVDEELITWFKQQRSQNVPVSGPMLKKKAEQLAKMKNYGDFVCSNGWIDRFKNRHSITFNKQGVIQSLKCNYRKALLSHILEHLADKTDFKINVLDSINFLAKAWRRVSPKTIKRAFNKAGFDSEEPQRTAELENKDKEDLPLAELIRAYRSACNLPFSENLFDYSEVDVEVQTCSSNSSVRIVADQDMEETSSDEEEKDVQPPPGLKEARQAIRLLSRFYESRITRPDIFRSIGQIEDDLERSVLFS
ncbi:hypothetical protein JTE90_017126 [Oedothorax gibbosus]|uniref:HTH CENPB-type domain-containing protein n=1 Tax=Oedothorax gibbosus TaxID=931172 RepID=A0AAV6UCS5_9ARAC|nr:hypothetical protein JTE90_017126 [Oedothorax gibbosus]